MFLFYNFYTFKVVESHRQPSHRTVGFPLEAVPKVGWVGEWRWWGGDGGGSEGKYLSNIKRGIPFHQTVYDYYTRTSEEYMKE